MKRGRIALRRIVVCSASGLLAVAASAFVPHRHVMAEESVQASDDASDEGVGDWILRLFRGSDEDESPPRSGDPKGNGNAGNGGGNSGGERSGACRSKR